MSEKRHGLRLGGSIYRNYLAVLVALVAVAVAVNLGVMAFVRSSLVSELTESQDAYIGSHAAFMDEAFSGIQNAMIDIAKSNAVSRRATGNYRQRPDYLTNEKDLVVMIKTLSFTSSAIDEILLWWNDSPYLYNKSGQISAQVYYENRFGEGYEAFSQMLAGHYPQMTLFLNPYRDSARDKGASAFYNGDDVTGLSGVYLLQSIPGSAAGIRGTVCVVLDKEFLDKVLRDQEFASSRQICMFNSEGQVILANQPAEQCGLLIEKAHSACLGNASEHWPGWGLLSHRKSAILDMEYLIFTPDQQMFSGFDRVFQAAGIVTAVAVALMLGYALIMPRRMYRPFKRILNALDPARTRTGRDDETAFITERILELLQTNHSMHRTVESSNHLVLQSVLYKILIGSPSVEESLGAVPGNALALPAGNYQAAVVRMDMPPDVDEQFFSDFGYHQEFVRFMREKLSRWLIDAVDTRPDEYTLCLCLQTAEEEAALGQALRQLHEGLCQRIPQATFYIGVSQRVGRVQDLNACYAQALQALQERPVQSEDQIWWAGAQTGAALVPFLPDDMEIQLRAHLEKAALDFLIPYTEDILDRNRRENVSYQAYQSACIVINRFIRRLVQGKDETVETDLIHIDPSKDVYTWQRCRDIVLSNLTLAADAFARPVKMQSSITDQAVAYVEAHFQENINLDVVAQALGYSPNHLSRHFKQKKGVNFTDYLNGRRVAHARQLIRESGLPLKDIAAQSGFGSANSLIRTFEKYEGMTPGEYRRAAC